jgi:hypothetical protein
VIRTNFTQKLAKKLEKFFIYRRKMIPHKLEVGEQPVEEFIFTCRGKLCEFSLSTTFCCFVEEISAKGAETVHF